MATTKRDTSQLDAMRSDKSSKEREKAEKEARKAEVDAKIARLEAAKTKLTEAKSNVEMLKNAVKNKEDQQDTWQGFNHDWYADYMPSTFRANYDAYYREIDVFLDAICDEITRLENESRDLWSGINWLVSAINSLGNQIEKWFN